MTPEVMNINFQILLKKGQQIGFSGTFDGNFWNDFHSKPFPIEVKQLRVSAYCDDVNDPPRGGRGLPVFPY